MYSIGADIGTSNIKAVAVDCNGTVRGASSRPNVPKKDAAGLGRYVYCAESVFSAALRCISESARGICPSEIKYFAVTGMAEAGVPLDCNGNVLYDVIPWNDTRAEGELAAIRETYSDFDLYQVTGQPLHPKYPIARLLWLRRNEKAVFAKTRHWLSLCDYVLYRLTGEMRTDYTQASRTMLFDIQSKRYIPELLDFCGLKEHVFAPAAAAGSCAGLVSEDILSRLGMSGARIEVCLGGHDHLAALSACEPSGGVFNSMGTSEVFVGITDRPILDEEVFRAGIAQGAIDDGRYYRMASLPSSGASLEWFARLLPTGGGYGELLKLSDEKIRTQILYMPYLNGSGTPKVNALAKAAFSGIGYADGPREMLKAIYEGISFQSKWILERLEGFLPAKVAGITACGGACRNIEWMKTKASILEKEITIYEVAELAAYGAAMACGKIKAPPQKLSVIKPDLSDENKYYYGEKYRRFLREAERY